MLDGVNVEKKHSCSGNICPIFFLYCDQHVRLADICKLVFEQDSCVYTHTHTHIGKMLKFDILRDRVRITDKTN